MIIFSFVIHKMPIQLGSYHYSFLAMACSTDVWLSALAICYSGRGKKKKKSVAIALRKGPSEGKKAVRAMVFNLFKLIDLVKHLK